VTVTTEQIVLLFDHRTHFLMLCFFFLFSFVIARLTQKKADEMKATSLQNALDTVEQLEQKLSDFAKKHQSEIQNDAVFRDR
jgi:uncharacterized membrane protein